MRIPIMTKVGIILLGSTILLATYYNGAGMDLALLCVIWGLLFVVAIIFLQPAAGTDKCIVLPSDSISIVMGLYFIWLLVAYQLSPMKVSSFYQVWLLASLPIAFLLWKLVKAKDQSWTLLWNLLLATGLITAGYGIHDLYEVFSNNTQPYINGQRYDPNNYATILVTILIPTMYYYSVKRHSTIITILYSFVIFLMAFGLLLSDSRAILLIWLTTQLILAVYIIKEKLYSKRLIYYLFIIVLAFISFQLIQQAFVGPQFDYSSLKSGNFSFLGARLYIWESAYKMYLSSPLTGTGLGTFSSVYPAYRHPAEVGTSGDSAHNDYLQFLVEGGPLHLLFLIIFLTVAIAILCIYFFKVKHSRAIKLNYGEGFALMLSGLAMLTEAFFNFTFSVLVFCLIFGLFLSRATDVAAAKKFGTISISRPKTTLGLASLVFLVPWSLLWTDTIIENVSGHHRYDGIRFFSLDDDVTKMRLAKMGSIFRPHNPTPKVILLGLYQGIQDTNNFKISTEEVENEIIFLYHSLIEDQPYSSTPQTLYGKYLNNLDKQELAIEQFEIALSKNPWDINTYIELAKTYYYKQDDYPRAIKLLMNTAIKKTKIDSTQKAWNMEIPLIHAAKNIALDAGEEDDILALTNILIRIDPEFASSDEKPVFLK